MQFIHNGKALKIADAHTHIYPGKIAEKATATVGAFYGIGMTQIGYPHTLVESGERIGVSRYLVCSVATTPGQAAAINSFIFEKCRQYPQFLGFAALHPAQKNWEAEIERILTLGLHGVKFHHDFQQVNLDDPCMLPIYRKLAACGLPVLLHMGDDRYDFTAPHRLYNVMQQVPGLTVLAAHLGGYRRWSEAARYLLCDNIFFDTSSSLWKLTRDEAVGLIHHFGPEKVLFGTDFPMWNHTEELGRFLSLGLTEAENEQILYRSFEQLFHVTV